MKEYHIPVLEKEVIDNLVLNPNGTYIDCTLGGGGHSETILKKLSNNGKLLAIDQDEDAINFTKKRLSRYNNFFVYKNNFSNMDIVLYMENIKEVDGILMDIGVSSYQLDEGDRGFSYRYDSKLDMRMDRKSNKLTAHYIVNSYSEEDLADIIFNYGEERFAKKIAAYIVKERQKKIIETTFDLSNIVKSAVGRRKNHHPAKKTFQGIRIEVNSELFELEKALEKSIKLLKKKGRLTVITFHSLEDRIVKNFFKDQVKKCICPSEQPICNCNYKPTGKIITKKPIVASQEEVSINNRAHSAKLRVFEKI